MAAVMLYHSGLMNLISALRSALKITLATATSVAGLVLILLAVRAVLKPISSAMFGPEIVRSGMFYLALIPISLIAYLSLLVTAIRIWEAGMKIWFLRTRQ